MRIRHSANHGRNRVRLISTPKGPLMGNIAGNRFSKQLTELLSHAIDHGFRIEPDHGKSAKDNGVVVYAPDKTVPPIRVSEVKARFNHAHTDNIRRQLERAGMPPMGAAPQDTPTTKEADDTPAPIPSPGTTSSGRDYHQTARDLVAVLPTNDVVDRALADPDVSPAVIAALTAGYADRAGVGPAEMDLVAAVNSTVLSWMLNYSPDRIAATKGGVSEEDLAAAEQLAEEATRQAADAENALARTEAKLEKATTDLRAALRRAEVAEAAHAELERVIAPLRSLLATPTPAPAPVPGPPPAKS